MINIPRILVASTLGFTLLCLGFSGSASAAVYVDNLPKTTTQQELINLFSQYGKVMKVSMVEDAHTGESTGAALVHMGNFVAEDEVLKVLPNTLFNGQRIKVSKSKPRVDQFGILRP